MRHGCAVLTVCTVYALNTGTPHRRGSEIIGAVAVVTDLTERNRIEQALAAARDQALGGVAP